MEEVIDLTDLFFNSGYEVRHIVVRDIELHIKALHDSATTDFDLTGQIIWPASRALAEYLCENKHYCNGNKILELGAGVGLSGLIASKLIVDPSSVYLTDNNQHILELLEKNIEENFTGEGRPICKNLSWGKDNVKDFAMECGDNFNLILGADVVFWPESVVLLIETVAELLSRQEDSYFLLSYVERSRHTTNLLLTQAEKANLIWEKVFLEDPNKFSAVQIYKFCHSH